MSEHSKGLGQLVISRKASMEALIQAELVRLHLWESEQIGSQGIVFREKVYAQIQRRDCYEGSIAPVGRAHATCEGRVSELELVNICSAVRRLACHGLDVASCQMSDLLGRTERPTSAPRASMLPGGV